MESGEDGHGERLERLWAGEFGNAYVDRNADAGARRGDWWRELLERLRPATALEIGCNIGGNLQWVAEVLGARNVTGIDVNEKALARLRERLPGVHAVHARAIELPFADRSFDLTYTMGVLIHQSPDDLPAVMGEVLRCSDRHVVCVEYFAEQEEEVPYRGHEGALYRRDYGGLYASLDPSLELLDSGYLARAEGAFDDATYWVFERSSA